MPASESKYTNHQLMLWLIAGCCTLATILAAILLTAAVISVQHSSRSGKLTYAAGIAAGTILCLMTTGLVTLSYRSDWGKNGKLNRDY